MKKAAFLAMAFGSWPCPFASAWPCDNTTLNPASYSSASGEYVLSVDPSDLNGRGPADCRFTRNGETVWTNRFPFSFWEAVVSDSGTVAGYAYERGRIGDYGNGHGDFRVAILSPDGATLGQESVARKNSIFFSEDPPRPSATGILLAGPPPLAIVRVVEPDGREDKEHWWVYDMATGARVATQDPRAQMSDADTLQSVLSAAPLPGMPLTLVHWLALDYPRCGAAFALLNLLGEPVWELSLPADYTCPEDDRREDDILRSIQRNGAVLAVGTNGTFDLQFVHDNLRVSYAVERLKPGPWKVRETARVPHALAPADARSTPPSAAPLEKIGEFRLRTAGSEPSNAVSGIVAFDFDPEGRICALKKPREAPALLYLTQQGDVLAEIPLPAGPEIDYPHFAGPASIGGQRFVVGFSPTVNTTRWFLADFEKGDIQLIAQVGDSRADACAGFPDGRFVALTTRHLQYTSSRGLSCFDAAGNLLWVRDDGAGYSHRYEELLSPEDLAVLGTNRIAVLDNIRHTLQLFDDGGDFRRILNLDDIWDRKPNYPTDIAPDEKGGWIVFDFNAPETLLRLNPDGAIRSASSPRLADGRPFRVYDGVKRSPQGDLWTCDGQSLIRLSTNSVANLVLGNASDAAVLSEPGLARVGPGDRIYVADSRSRSLHVFDASGKPLGTCIPDPADLDDTAHVSHLAFSSDGHVFASLGSRDAGYLHFDEQGRRLGRARVAAERGCPPLYFQPTGTRCWAIGRHDLFLLDGLSNELRRIRRKADGQWLDDPGLAAVAPDGSIAIHGAGSTINLYDADGNARSTFVFPVYPRFSYYSAFAPPAYDGRRVYVRSNNLLSMFETHGTPLGVFSFGTELQTEKWSGPFLAAQGRELWFIAPGDLSVHRYAIP